MKEIVETFKNPGCEFRGAPFWAWNGKLEPDELRRQIRVMKKMGLGGFFMHSRIGLDTAYLSEEWFECIQCCIDEAEKLDMDAWLYDEDRWPSGAAGGLVTKKHANRALIVIMEELASIEEVDWDDQVIAVFTGCMLDDGIKSIRRLLQHSTEIEAGESILCFRIEELPETSWYNGQTYLDVLSEDAVATFIEVTHEEYRKHVGDTFGKRIPGIFTDEPNYPSVCENHDNGSTSIPWSLDLEEFFRNKYGYNIIDHLPEIFFNIEGQPVSKARYDYHDCLTSMFVKAYAKQIGDWCELNGMIHTGHVLVEDSLSMQTSRVGSCMRFYEYMQAPGMDLLTERFTLYDTAKQVSSVARQFDRKWRLTETYGCTGWDFPFKGHKALGDWQVAMGINLHCQHMAWYTMRGEAKRDYPASISYQSPWWNLYRKVEDYFGRIISVMTNGHEVRDILVVHPNESMWTLCRKGWIEDPTVHELNKMLAELRNTLLNANLDFDYGDEEIMSRHGSVEADISPVLRVGVATYKAVIVPPLKTIRSTTLALLTEFKAAGGLVVFAGEIPKHLDAEPSEAPAQLAYSCMIAPASGVELAESVESCRKVSIQDKTGTEIDNALYLLREDQDNSYLFVCNTSFSPSQRETLVNPLGVNALVVDRTEAYDVVKISGFEEHTGNPLELDADTGDIMEVEHTRENGKLTINTSLLALGSRLFVIPKKNTEINSIQPVKRQQNLRCNTIEDNDWKVLYTEDNVMVLDQPRYSIDGGCFKSDEILRVDREVRDYLGVQPRGKEMVQPWAKELNPEPKRTALKLEYSFRIIDLPNTPLHLGIESPQCFNIFINGNGLNSDLENGWWCDNSLRKLIIPPTFLHKGENTIAMHCDYDENHSGLEIVYLLGMFGVQIAPDGIMEMSALPDKLKLNDWTTQGLPFYSGAITYCKTLNLEYSDNEHIFIQIPAFRGTAVEIRVNDIEAGIIGWEPQEMEITTLIKSGECFELRINVVAHRRNSHGPFHGLEKWPLFTGSNQFRVETDEQRKTYSLVPCGLMASPVIIVKSDTLHD